MKNLYAPLLVGSLLTAISAQAAVLDISGTIASTSASVPHEGTVTGTFDDVTKILDINVSFFSSTTLDDSTTGMTIANNSAIANTVSITLGDPTAAGAIALASGSFTFISFAEPASANGVSNFPTTGAPHMVQGAFTLTPAEETALAGGDIFTRVDGSDADGIAALSASAVPEPSTALLSFAGLALLARRRRA